MTYGVLPITVTAYNDMIPTLTAAQKKYIYDALVEAREHAMDGGSSKEKHAWFGKYKGRINNYLSKEGYDLTKEREGWNKRIAEKEKDKKKE
jgi:cytochrome c553